MNAADSIERLLKPEWEAWNAIEPRAAKAFGRQMARSTDVFSLGSMPLVAAWLSHHAGRDAPFVRSVGDAHHRCFTTHAHGRLRPDGRPAVGFDISFSDHRHPAPWHWDLVRLLASVALTKTMSTGALASLATVLSAEYLRILVRIAEDDSEAALRIDINGLPEVLKRVIEKHSTADVFDGFLTRHCSGLPHQPRLRSTAYSTEVTQTCRLLAGHVSTSLQGLRTLDRATISVVPWTARNPLIPSRSGWLALVREQHRTGTWYPRLVAIHERQVSAMCQVLPVNPFPLRASLPNATAPDPCEHVFIAAGRTMRTTSLSHTRHTPALRTIDDGDLIRLTRLWGQLLAGAHANGLAALGVSVSSHIHVIKDDAQQRHETLAGLAGDLARFTSQAHGAWVKATGPSKRSGRV